MRFERGEMRKLTPETRPKRVGMKPVGLRPRHDAHTRAAAGWQRQAHGLARRERAGIEASNRQPIAGHQRAAAHGRPCR